MLSGYMLLALNACETLYKGVLILICKREEKEGPKRKKQNNICVKKNKIATWLKKFSKRGLKSGLCVFETYLGKNYPLKPSFRSSTTTCE